MKIYWVFLLAISVSACNPLASKNTVREAYYVPVIQSDKAVAPQTNTRVMQISDKPRTPAANSEQNYTPVIQ